MRIDEIEEAARIFAYQCDPKVWKSFTPIHRKEGFKAGVEWALKQTTQFKDRKELRLFMRELCLQFDKKEEASQ